MAVFETSPVHNEGVYAKGRGLFTNLVAAIADWNDRRVTRNALSALSARELADIGLTRSDLSNF